MTTRPYGDVSYTLTNLVVAPYDMELGTYGTPVTMADGQMYVSEPEHDTDKMRGYGKYTRGLSVAVGTKISLKAGGFSVDLLAVIAAAIVTESGASGNRVKKIKFSAGGAGLGYFGVIGVAATDDGGVAVLGHKAVKLEAIPSFTMDGEANKFNNLEAEGYSYPQDDTLETVQQYEDAADWTAPATGNDFGDFFS